MKKYFLIVLLGLIVFTSGCPEQNEISDEKANLTIKYFDSESNLILDESFEVAKGKNAFEAMNENLDLEYDEFAFGVMVKSIAGVGPPEGYYLALYVDGEYAAKGISDYSAGEVILVEWRTEKLENFS